MIATFSKGILKRRLLPVALGEGLVVASRSNSTDGLTGVIGWGLKDNTQKARTYAKQHDLPYFSLEDGFVRSVGLGVTGSEPFGFIVDKQGIYYNARRPSDVEDHIKAAETIDTARVNRLIERMVGLQVSKYNHVWRSPDLPNDGLPNILLIDQTCGDLSVKYGMADESNFRKMVDAAMQRYPKARFFVKTHPDVIAGKKKGYLTDRLPSEVNLISEDCNPMGLLAQVDHVYTVTSQMGFEALLAGKRVTCFGMPFYAGWGLTEDHIQCPRRDVTRSLEQVFSAAYLDYVRYVDPITEQPCELERILDLIENHKRIATQNIGNIYCFSFRWWKRGVINQFLGSAETAINFPKKRAEKNFSITPSPDRVVVWGAADDPPVRNMAEQFNISIERVEDGFLRSVGLGSDFTRPLSLIVDRCGIYFDPRQPSDLENLLNTIALDEDQIARAKNLRQHIVTRGISKYNTGTCKLPVVDGIFNPIIFIPGQVEDDASIQTGCIDIKTNLDLLKTVRRENPEAFIIFKPHPDVVAGNRVGAVSEETAVTYCDAFVTDCDINGCLDRADEIHTMTSLTGFEALLRGKRVYTYGLPFYAGWGLTTDRHAIERRRRRRTVEELLYCALVLYPRYYDWGARMFVSVEDAIASLTSSKTSRQASVEMSWWRRLKLKAGHLVENVGLMKK